MCLVEERGKLGVGIWVEIEEEGMGRVVIRLVWCDN